MHSKHFVISLTPAPNANVLSSFAFGSLGLPLHKTIPGLNKHDDCQRPDCYWTNIDIHYEEYFVEKIVGRQDHILKWLIKWEKCVYHIPHSISLWENNTLTFVLFGV